MILNLYPCSRSHPASNDKILADKGHREYKFDLENNLLLIDLSMLRVRGY